MWDCWRGGGQIPLILALHTLVGLPASDFESCQDVQLVLSGPIPTRAGKLGRAYLEDQCAACGWRLGLFSRLGCLKWLGIFPSPSLDRQFHVGFSP